MLLAYLWYMEGSLLDVGTYFYLISVLIRSRCVQKYVFFKIEKVSQVAEGGRVNERLGQCPKFSRFLILERSLNKPFTAVPL